jgi:hypothetical protein
VDSNVLLLLPSLEIPHIDNNHGPSLGIDSFMPPGRLHEQNIVPVDLFVSDSVDNTLNNSAGLQPLVIHLPNQIDGFAALHEPDSVDWSSTKNDYFKGLDWLSEEMKDEVCRLEPAMDDIDADGNVNTGKLAIAASLVFVEGRWFHNFIQLAQMADFFASKWGYVSTIAGLECRCNCPKANKAPYKSTASPASQRESQPSMKDVKCTFVIKTYAPRKYHSKQGTPNAAYPVTISGACFEHTCEPGKLHQLACSKSAGKYAYLIGGKLREVAQMLRTTNLPCSSLRQILRRSLPKDCTITSTDVHNFRLRALLSYVNNSPDGIDNMLDGLLHHRDLDLSERQALMSDAVTHHSEEFLKKTLRGIANADPDSEHAQFEALGYLSFLKTLPGFDYRLHVSDDDTKVVGIVWMTRQNRKDWLRYGDILSLDAQKKHINTFRWPYMSAVVKNNENKMAVCCEAIVIGETVAQYDFVLSSLQEMEPRRQLSSVKAVFADRFLSQDIVVRMGMTNAEFFLDHYHLYHHIWPKNMSQASFGRVQDDLMALLKAKSIDAFRAARGSIRQS